MIWFVISAPRRQTLSSRAAQSARDLTMFEVVKELCAILRCAQDDSDGKTFVVSPPFSPIHDLWSLRTRKEKTLH